MAKAAIDPTEPGKRNPAHVPAIFHPEPENALGPLASCLRALSQLAFAEPHVHLGDDDHCGMGYLLDAVACGVAQAGDAAADMRGTLWRLEQQLASRPAAHRELGQRHRLTAEAEAGAAFNEGYAAGLAAARAANVTSNAAEPSAPSLTEPLADPAERRRQRG